MLYVQLLAFPILVVLGIKLGRILGPGKWWWVGFALTLAWVLLVAGGRRIERLAFVAPVSWAVDADVGPLVMTPVVAVLFTILIMRMPGRRPSKAIGTMMAVLLAYFGLLPALLPLAVRPSLAATVTIEDGRGVCLQTHNYTCGPAAMVTCLRRLGIAAEEGAVALEARAAPALGTDGRLLAAAVTRLYGQSGEVRCEFRYAGRVEELSVPAVVDMVIPKVGGHYVAVLAVEGEQVLVGDPLKGEVWMARGDFEKWWRHGAVVFER